MPRSPEESSLHHARGADGESATNVVGKFCRSPALGTGNSEDPWRMTSSTVRSRTMPYPSELHAHCVQSSLGGERNTKTSAFERKKRLKEEPSSNATREVTCWMASWDLATRGRGRFLPSRVERQERHAALTDNGLPWRSYSSKAVVRDFRFHR